MKTTLIECYKIAFGLSHLKFNDYFEYAKLKSTDRENHSHKLYLKQNKLLQILISYKNCIQLWNDLPYKVVEADNLSTFKKEF
jgi:hypothetical protein